MNKRILTRLLCIFGITALSIYLFAGLPPRIDKMKERIHLGLDLRGGVQLVLQVVTDDAVRTETDQTIETLRQQFQADHVTFQQIYRNQIDEFRIDGIDAAADTAVRRALSENFTQWERIPADSTPGTVTLRLKAAEETALRSEAVQQSMRTIGNRLDSLGVGEVSVQQYGARDDWSMMVQVPGAEDPERVKSIVQATALLEFRLVDGGPFRSEQEAAASYGGTIPAALEALRMTAKDASSDSSAPYYVVQRVAPISGRDLRNASVARDENGKPAVGFKLTADGSRRFGGLTEQNIGKPMAIVLDKTIQSVARIDGRIEDSGIIRGGTGGFTVQQVQDLVLILKSGALPASVRYHGEQVVGPSLGADSIRQGMIASAVALSVVTIFMIAYYRFSGINATIAMLLNLCILLGALAYFHATLTLPGIAGFVLTIGVGIDSNVLIFERIREELHAGKTAASAVAVSFQRVFMTLVDTHFAALISAAFLFAFGTGPIQGFAVTLVIGLVSNMFTAVFVSRTLFELVLLRKRGAAPISI